MPIAYTGEIITSRQNRRVVELMKLDDRRAREAGRHFRFDGLKLLCEALRRGVEPEAVYVRESSADRLAERMEALYGYTPADICCPIFGVSDGLFDKISTENAPEGVIGVAKYLDKCHKMSTIYERDGHAPAPTAPILLLESVRDPLNVGAVIRSAAALGVSELVISADCADIYHPRTLRAAMGPLFSLPITRVTDMEGSIRALRAAGHRVYAAALDHTAFSLGSPALVEDMAKSPLPPCAVIGNEGHGLTDGTIAACDRSVYIPMQADTESLNAGVAAALILWELCRATR